MNLLARVMEEQSFRASGPTTVRLPISFRVIDLPDIQLAVVGVFCDHIFMVRRPFCLPYSVKILAKLMAFRVKLACREGKIQNVIRQSALDRTTL